MSTVIKIENVSKQYRLGLIGTNTLKGDLQRWWYNMRGLPNPTLMIGQENILKNGGLDKEKNNEYVWALRNINFEVKQGEVLGIIGKNGAGKSTLLKLLSRVTAPTTGEIKVKGRIASLLEVGTGFHPDLTGRENIFLNGAILGMTKSEIRSKLEEIIDFAGIAKYIDTPVKRYSSGMYVRLAFAVAAHLEPEILIVDEVLAVGDVEFQKKAIGKMQDVSTKDGRTVLFVSHNMAAVSVLTKRCILLREGNLIASDITSKIIEKYTISHELSGESNFDITKNAPGSDNVKLLSVRITNNGKVTSEVLINQEIKIEIDYYNFKQDAIYDVNIHLKSFDGTYLLATTNWSTANLIKDDWFNKPRPVGKFQTVCIFPANFFNDQQYIIDVGITNEKNQWEVDAKSAIVFNVIDNGEMRNEYVGKWVGVIRPKFEWNSKLID